MENPEIRYPRDPSTKVPLEPEVIDATLPGKASKLQVVIDRTVNRHWWVRR